MAPLTSPCLAKATLIAVVVLLAPTPALAHGDFDARVASLSAQIQEQPSAARYLERSIVYQGHGGLAAALADLEQAERLDPTRADLALHRGRLALAAGRPEEAVAPLRGCSRRPRTTLKRTWRSPDWIASPRGNDREGKAHTGPSHG